MRSVPVVVLLCGVLGLPIPVAAQQGSTEYPQRPIRLVLPFAPGGGSDLLGRTIGQRLPSALGQQIIIDNRPGGAAMIGADLVAKSRPDGYTLLFSSGAPISINLSLYSKMPYDPVRDLAPITLVASYANLLIVHPSLPVRSVKELIALAKSRPGQMSYASGGNGTTQHLAGEMLKTLAGVDIVHVPYKGAGPAVIDLIGGHVSLFFNTTGAALPFVKSGKVRALGVTSAKRSSALPDLPTIAETLPGFEAIAWAGVFAPAGTPRGIVDRLNHETVKILQIPEVRKSLDTQGFDIVGNSPEEFAAHIQTDIARWAKVIKASGIRAD